MMLTTLGSPPWVATCSKGAGAAAFGKKMLIRLPISHYLYLQTLCKRSSVIVNIIVTNI